MHTNMTPLSSFVADEVSKSTLPLREVKSEIAHCLEIGVSTLYLWLKSGDYYVEHIGASQAGDDSALTVWKMEKFLT